MEEAPRRKKKKTLKIRYKKLKLSLQHDREFENKASSPRDHSDPPSVCWIISLRIRFARQQGSTS